MIEVFAGAVLEKVNPTSDTKSSAVYHERPCAIGLQQSTMSRIKDREGSRD